MRELLRSLGFGFSSVASSHVTQLRQSPWLVLPYPLTNPVACLSLPAHACAPTSPPHTPHPAPNHPVRPHPLMLTYPPALPTPHTAYPAPNHPRPSSPALVLLPARTHVPLRARVPTAVPQVVAGLEAAAAAAVAAASTAALGVVTAAVAAASTAALGVVTREHDQNVFRPQLSVQQPGMVQRLQAASHLRGIFGRLVGWSVGEWVGGLLTTLRAAAWSDPAFAATGGCPFVSYLFV
eukprot:355521-Chlamydomonas_euryale.AAC.2